MDKKAIARAIGAGLSDEQVRERLRQIDTFLNQTNFQTWDLVVSIAAQADGRMLGIEGEFEAWPNNVKDMILAAMVLDCEPRPGHGIRIVASGCFQDVAYEPAYLRVVVQEFPEKVH